MTTATTACWADPLTQRERAELARKLARASKRFWDVYAFTSDLDSVRTCRFVSAEMADLHLDVTERAEVPAS